MLAMRIYQHLNMQVTSNVMTWQHEVMSVHIALLSLNQYLGLFRPPELTYYRPVTYQTLLDNKTPENNLFTTLATTLGQLKINNSKSRDMLLTAIKTVTMIDFNANYAHILQTWNDTYAVVAQTHRQVHTNYVPNQIIMQLHRYLTPLEGARIYSENIGNRKLALDLGGSNSYYTDYTDCDAITQLFSEVHHLIINVPSHHVVKGTNIYSGKYDLAVINWGTVSASSSSVFELPTRDAKARLSLQKLTQLVSPPRKSSNYC